LADGRLIRVGVQGDEAMPRLERSEPESEDEMHLGGRSEDEVPQLESGSELGSGFGDDDPPPLQNWDTEVPDLESLPGSEDESVAPLEDVNSSSSSSDSEPEPTPLQIPSFIANAPPHVVQPPPTAPLPGPMPGELILPHAPAAPAAPAAPLPPPLSNPAPNANNAVHAAEVDASDEEVPFFDVPEEGKYDGDSEEVEEDVPRRWPRTEPPRPENRKVTPPAESERAVVQPDVEVAGPSGVEVPEDAVTVLVLAPKASGKGGGGSGGPGKGGKARGASDDDIPPLEDVHSGSDSSDGDKPAAAPAPAPAKATAAASGSGAKQAPAKSGAAPKATAAPPKAAAAPPKGGPSKAKPASGSDSEPPALEDIDSDSEADDSDAPPKKKTPVKTATSKTAKPAAPAQGTAGAGKAAAAPKASTAKAAPPPKATPKKTADDDLPPLEDIASSDEDVSDDDEPRPAKAAPKKATPAPAKPAAPAAAKPAPAPPKKQGPPVLNPATDPTVGVPAPPRPQPMPAPAAPAAAAPRAAAPTPLNVEFIEVDVPGAGDAVTTMPGSEDVDDQPPLRLPGDEVIMRPLPTARTQPTPAASSSTAKKAPVPAPP
jgi:hypothetical protein